MIKINKFKKFTKKFTKTYGEEFGVKWYGSYRGRFSHNGIAVTAESTYGIAKFVSAMEKNNIDLGSWDQQDQLGYGQIFSWNTSKFNDAKEVA